MTRYALVPLVETLAMSDAGIRRIPVDNYRAEIVHDVYTSMLAASPGQGAVTAAQLEAAATAHSGAPFPSKRAVDRMRLALEAIGLTVQP